MARIEPKRSKQGTRQASRNTGNAFKYIAASREQGLGFVGAQGEVVAKPVQMLCDLGQHVRSESHPSTLRAGPTWRCRVVRGWAAR